MFYLYIVNRAFHFTKGRVVVLSTIFMITGHTLILNITGSGPGLINNMNLFEDQGCCWIGSGLDRPYSGVTAVVDFSAHNHIRQE